MKFSPSFLLWSIHVFALTGLALYGLHRIRFLWLWAKIRHRPPIAFTPKEVKDLPRITIQLPLYNERFVAKRLLAAASRLDWPKDRLEIQVLDDSTDDTTEIVDQTVREIEKRGVSITILRRKDRKGFKAGALMNGLGRAGGEFVAVFDADFIPPEDFLTKTIPHFTSEDVGMVQCRWGFLNEKHSWLTRIQSLLLSSHFRIEHYVRFHCGFFFNFNGTAGIWRKKAIISSGGWQWDTITEDLDLSYRAQLKGWRFVYLDDYAVPSELPVTLAAFRSQQQRWAKGSIQTAKKLLPVILRTKHLSLAVKLESAAHLLANLGWLMCSLLILTLYPAVLMSTTDISYLLLKLDMGLFFYSSGAVLIYFLFYAIGVRSGSGYWLWLIPFLSIGMAPVLSFSVFSGFLSKGGVFRRTPKYGVKDQEGVAGPMAFYPSPRLNAVLVNVPILLYTLVPVLFLWHSDIRAVIFPLLFPLGFFLVIVKDIVDFFNRKRPVV